MTFKDVCTIYVLNILNKYCESKNKKLCIARSSTRKEKKVKLSQKDEMKFFNEYLKNFYTEDIDSFSLSEKSEVVICLASNLGPELLSRGKKVLFLNVNSLINDWPFLPLEEGPFWYKGKNIKTIEQKLVYMFSINATEWKDILDKSQVSMLYDPGNLKLKQLVYRLCSE